MEAAAHDIQTELRAVTAAQPYRIGDISKYIFLQSRVLSEWDSMILFLDTLLGYSLSYENF